MIDDAAPADFLEHLEARLGVDHPTAFSTLADWLAQYQPVARRKIEFSNENDSSTTDAPPAQRMRQVA